MKNEQNKICEYIGNCQCRDELNHQSAQNIIEKTKVDFLIGKEAQPKNESTSRYFKIFFNEVRTDQEFIQITPTVCFKSGYLKVDQEGSLSLTDDNFIPYLASKKFYVDQDQLKAREDWDIASRERFSSKCVKGLLSFGMFAAVVGALYYAATNTDDLTMSI